MNSAIRRFCCPAVLTVLAAGVTACTSTATVKCGDQLSASTTLRADLLCPLGNGLSLGRGVTLDLGGHRLVGPGITHSDSVGVTGFLGGSSSVVNGQIQGWGIGVSENKEDPDVAASSLRLHKVTLWRNATGAVVQEAALSVTSSSFRHNQAGIFGFYGTIDIHHTRFLGNGAVNGGGGSLTIDRSTLDGTGSAEPPATCSESGLSITNSSVAHYPQPAGGYDCAGVTLTGDTFTGNASAFQSTHDLITPPVTTTDGEQIISNTFMGNGIAVQSGVSGRIANNTFIGNTTGVITTSASVLVTANTFIRNTSSGISDPSGAGTRIGRNTSIRNGEYGIYAPGAIDLGGNVAYANSRSPQCVGVVCAIIRPAGG